MRKTFIEAIENRDLDILKKIDKGDLHNHATRGSNIEFIEEWCGKKLERAPLKFDDLDDMQAWYTRSIKPVCVGAEGFIKRVEGAFAQAKDDGIKVLSMSFGIGDSIFFNNNLHEFTRVIKDIHRKIAGDIHFIPELALNRTNHIKPVESMFDEVLELGFFKALDLMGDDRQPVDNYKGIFRKAKDSGFILKAHVGEFSDCESVRQAVDILELDQVQHGIAAADSEEIMSWLSRNKVQLNVCPTSNVMLKRVEDYKTHPIRRLYDAGIPVTINTDDMLIFNQSVSQDYLNLYNAGVFSAEELNIIRENSLI